MSRRRTAPGRGRTQPCACWRAAAWRTCCGSCARPDGLTYDEVQAETGLSQQTLFDVEYKTRRLTLAELRLLAACYDVGVSDILGVEIEDAAMEDRSAGV